MRGLLISIIFLVIITLFSCNDQKTTIPDSTIYESCCGIEPVEFIYDSAYMFVPNVFTPNGDGINDFFAPQFNSGILGFDTYLIFSLVGDTLLWASVGYDTSNIENTAWNGMLSDGIPYIGLFKYKFTVFLSDGGLYLIEGHACRIECNHEAAEFNEKTGCFFPIQFDSSGRLNQDAPNYESSCFDH